MTKCPFRHPFESYVLTYIALRCQYSIPFLNKHRCQSFVCDVECATITIKIKNSSVSYIYAK